MTTDADITAEGRLLAALKDGKAVFVNMVDTAAVEAYRNQHQNQDLLVSMCLYAAPNPSAPRTWPLYFVIAAQSVEAARVSALGAAYYITENFGMPAECTDITYDSGGKVGNIAAGDNDDFADKAGDTADTSGQAPQLYDQGAAGAGVAAGDNDDIGGNVGNAISTDAARKHNPAASLSHAGGHLSSGNAKEGAIAAEMVISILPIVFDGPPTPLMLALNYHLDRQAADDSLNLNIHAHQRGHCVDLPNIACSAQARSKSLDALSCCNALAQAIEDTLGASYESPWAFVVSCGQPIRIEEGCNVRNNCCYIKMWSMPNDIVSDQDKRK